MRTIKFRAKRTDEDKHPYNKWIYGHYFQAPLTIENFGGGFLNTPDQKKLDCIEKDGVVYSIKIETLGQFTGLFDKNGKEIYEGDVIKWESKWSRIKYENQKSITDFSNPIYYNENLVETVGQVVFDVINDIDDFYSPYVLGFGLRVRGETVTSLYDVLKNYDKEIAVNSAYSITYGQKYEIIGNIYDNPELLNQ